MRHFAWYSRFIWFTQITVVLLVAEATVANAQENKPARAITYIAVSAKLDDCLAQYEYGDKHKPTCGVIVNGVTNLPVNSVLRIYVYDYIGQGSKAFYDGATVIVGPTGEFKTTVQAKSGLQMRANLQVSVTFFPDWDQPTSVVEKLGKRGENLNGPQIGGNRGGTYLTAITVVVP